MAADQNKESMLDGFMALAGVGIGAAFGPLSVHARFSQPEERVAIVTSLNIFFRTFGGTVGLAQCGTVLNAKVRSYLMSLSPSQVSDLQGSSLSPVGLSSLQSIADLPPDVQNLVKDAFRNGIKWCFISLIPWTALAAIAVLFLSNIPDINKQSVATPREEMIEETEPEKMKVERSASNLA